MESIVNITFSSHSILLYPILLAIPALRDMALFSHVSFQNIGMPDDFETSI